MRVCTWEDLSIEESFVQKGIFHRGGAGLLATLGVPHATDVEVV